MTSIGEFLREKFTNFAKWLETELGDETLCTHIITQIKQRSTVELVCLSEVIGSETVLISHRDWNALIRYLQSFEYARQVVPLIQEIRVRPNLHVKFWRYMELFRDVAQNSNTALDKIQ